MSNSNDTGKVIGAALLGAAVGAALGLLLAPDKGSETRKKLVKSLKDLTGDLKTAFEEAAQSDADPEEEPAKA